MYKFNDLYHKNVSGKTIYRFVDGGYFENYCASIEQLVGVQFFRYINFNQFSFEVGRQFYYDALPVQKPGQSEQDYQVVLRNKTEFLNKIRLSEKCHVRDGVTRLRSGSRRGLEQKGVDILLAVEVLQLAARNVFDVAEIVTGDLDFYPVFEALQQTKVMGTLISDMHRVPDELVFPTDFRMDLDPETLMQSIGNEIALKIGFYVDYDGQSDLCDNVIYRHSSNGRNGFITKNHNGVYAMKTGSVGNTFSSKNLGRLLLLLKSYGHDLSDESVRTLLRELP